MTRRVLGYIVLLISILALPYWIYIPVLFITIFFFPFFWEGILFALLIDTVYGNGISVFPFIISPLVLAALIAPIIFLPFRESLRSHVSR